MNTKIIKEKTKMLQIPVTEKQFDTLKEKADKEKTKEAPKTEAAVASKEAPKAKKVKEVKADAKEAPKAEEVKATTSKEETK